MAVRLENWEIEELIRSEARAKAKIERLREIGGNGNSMECTAKEEDNLHRIFILQTGVIS